MFNNKKAAFDFDVYDTNKKSLRDFFGGEFFNLGRDVLCNGRATDKNKNNPTVAVRIAEGGSPGGSEEKYYSGKVLRRQIKPGSL